MGIGATWLLPLALTGASADIPVEGAQTPVPDLIPGLIEDAFSQVQLQVQTRQRVMIRITPLSRAAPPPQVSLPKVEPRRAPAEPGAVQQCIALADVTGLRLGSGRSLLLYMRDRRIISTLLDRSCQVSSFYSGFYVERPADGMLCAGREALHARSGADCQLSAFRDITPGKN